MRLRWLAQRDFAVAGAAAAGVAAAGAAAVGADVAGAVRLRRAGGAGGGAELVSELSGASSCWRSRPSLKTVAPVSK